MKPAVFAYRVAKLSKPARLASESQVCGSERFLVLFSLSRVSSQFFFCLSSALKMLRLTLCSSYLTKIYIKFQNVNQGVTAAPCRQNQFRVQVLYRRQLDLFQFVEDVSCLFREVSNLVEELQALNSVCECPYTVWEFPTTLCEGTPTQSLKVCSSSSYFQTSFAH